MRRWLLGAVLVVALASAGAAAAFDNTEPEASQEWYLELDKAWAYWPSMPSLVPVKVAVIDSGIDAGHPEFQGRIAAGRSFVSGSWKQDEDGHGTFVAGEIAADPSNNEGMAGLAFNAQLLIAKVVEPNSGNVSLDAEVRAIYWSVAQGARVINLSLGGQRDPADARFDYYSPAERKAVEYAYSKGVVVVAAVGNSNEAPATPWKYADYPAALPHVIGVGALTQSGSVPSYSDRDQVYVDVAAPGDRIFSTVPRALVDRMLPDCAGFAYSDCGPLEFRNAIGTSFAAPQVSAAAALLLGVDPKLKPDQVSWLLERTATDEKAATGCSQCPPGRDPYTGWGRLNVDAALTSLKRLLYPQPDAYETNDDAGQWAHAFGPPRTISATLDYWDDPDDVYSIEVTKGQKLYARLSAPPQAGASLFLWKPGTQTVLGLRAITGESKALGAKTAADRLLSFTAPQSGRYFLQVKLGRETRMPVGYRLAVARS